MATQHISVVWCAVTRVSLMNSQIIWIRVREGVLTNRRDVSGGHDLVLRAFPLKFETSFPGLFP